MKEVTATVTDKKVIISKKFLDSTKMGSDELKKLFKKYGITHVDQRLGLSDHVNGDQPDDTYPVEDWLEWSRSVE